MRRRSTIPRLSAAAVAAAGPSWRESSPHRRRTPPTSRTRSRRCRATRATTPLAGPDRHGRGRRHRRPPRQAAIRGIYVQTAGRGATRCHARRSDGIFVFLATNAAAGVAIGDHGDASPAPPASSTPYRRSHASAAAAVGRARAGRASACPRRRRCPPPSSARAREAFEGMLVRPTGTYKLVSSHNLQNFGELWLSAGTAMPVEAFETRRAEHQGGERHHDRQQQRPAAARRRLQHPRRQRRATPATSRTSPRTWSCATATS